MGHVEYQCPRCGAPIAARATGVVHCEYCATPLTPTRDGFRIANSFREDDELVDPELPRFWLGGARYVLLGRISQGEGSDVFLGRRDHRLTERVVVKVLRAREDRDLLEREWKTVTALQRSNARGAAHFTRLLPQPVVHGEARLGVLGHEGTRLMSLYQFASGFVHSFGDVRNAYPEGVAPAAAIWLWKRLLEILGFLHENEIVHGAVLPAHLLVHARDHGVRLCGFSRAGPSGEPLPATTEGLADFYPHEAWNGGAATAVTDLVMSARCIMWVLAGKTLGLSPASTPRPLAQVLERCATEHAGGFRDCHEVLSAVDQAAAEVFGPPKYVPFAMPGWKIAGA